MAIPLIELIPEQLLPIDRIVVSEPNQSWLNRVRVIGLQERRVDPDEQDEILAVLSIPEEVVFQFPGVEGIELAIGGFREPNVLTTLRLGSGTFQFGLDGNPRLRFSQEYLRPVVRQNNSWVDDTSRSYSEIEINTNVVIDQDWNVTFEGSNEFALRLSMIGTTGVVIEARQIIPALFDNRPDGIPSSIPQTWKGIYIDDATIYLPLDISVTIPSDIQLDNFFIGLGGFCGKITGKWTPQLNSDRTEFTGNGAGDIYGMPFALKEIAIEFKQNTLVESKIKGALILPFFDQPVVCEIGLTNDGDFTVALSADQTLPAGLNAPTPTDDGLFVFTKQDLLELKLKSIAFEKQEDVFAIQLGGDIKPLFGGYDWPEFEVEALRIDSTGKVSVDGGWIDIDRQGILEFEGAVVEISKIGFGSEDDGTRWLGVSGGLKLADPLPMSGSVEGLRANWRDDTFWIELRGAAVGFEIPDSLRFAGHLEFIEDPAEPRGADVPKKRGFRGGGKLQVIPTNLAITAEVVVGRNEEQPPYPFVYLFVAFQSPVGIPLGSTGASFYGFAGLTALHMEPGKRPEDAWWDDWYMKSPPGVAHSGKWQPQRGSLALGAGVTLGTAFDDGYAVNSRLLLVLAVPGPIIMLEGIAAFLQDRSKLGDNPPFRALAVLDGRAGQFLMNMQGRYPFDSSDPMNNVIQVTAGSEAYFDSSGDWHFFLGQREPMDKRIRAKIIKLFEANSYLMLFPDRVALGIWVGYKRKWKFGPLKVKLAAWIEANALLSWSPPQFRGNLAMVGDICLRAFGIGTCISLRTFIETQAATPFFVYAEIEGRLKTGRWLPNPKFHIEWKYEDLSAPPILNPLGAAGVVHLKVSEKWPLEINGEESNAPTVPLDGKIAISFSHTVYDAAMVGTNPSGIAPRERVGDYEFEYGLIEVELQKHSKNANSNSWEIVATRTAEDPEADKDKLWGVWLAVDGLAGGTSVTPNAPMTKLMLFARSPFEIANETIDDTFYDHFGEFHPDFGWTRANPPKKQCFDFDGLIEKKEEIFPFIRLGDVLIIGENLLVQPWSSPQFRDISSQLRIGYHTWMPTSILFPETVKEVTLTFANARLQAELYNGTMEMGNRRVESPNLTTVTLEADDKLEWTTLVLSGPGALIQVCYVAAEEANRFAKEIATVDHASNAGDTYCYPPDAELLSPESYYRIRVVTETRRRSTNGGDWHIQAFENISYFQTAKPPGIYEPKNEGAMTPENHTEQYPVSGPLKDLRPYVAKLTPMEGSPSVYRGYDVGIEFNEPYVEHMYLGSDMPLSIGLYDNNGERSATGSNGPEAAGAAWQTNDVQTHSRAIQEHVAASMHAKAKLEASLEDAGGVETALAEQMSIAYTKVALIDLACAPKSKGIWTGGDDFVLKPRTLCRASVEPIQPQIVFHLDHQGLPIMIGDVIRYDRISPDGSNLNAVLVDSVGLEEPGIKVVSDGVTFVARTGSSDSDELEPAVNWPLIKELSGDIFKTIPPKPPVHSVYTWSFITSRFATFVHHIHSFIDAAWDRREALSLTSWTGLAQVEHNELKTLVEAADLELNHLYNRASELFLLDENEMPDRLEIQILQGDNRRYGFLIESPEPINWVQNVPGRVSLTVKHSPNAMNGSEASFGVAKFIDCNLKDPEWVEVLVQENQDLSGYQIRCVRDEIEEGFKDYFTFPAGSIMGAGTVVRVHAGSEVSSTSDKERTDIYIGAEEQILLKEGEVLELLDSQGRQVHRRHFMPEENFSMQYDIVIASDTDGLRSFVFLLDGGSYIDQVPDGSFLFNWTFRRDAGEILPKLRRKGSLAPEKANNQFNVPSEFP